MLVAGEPAEANLQAGRWREPLTPMLAELWVGKDVGNRSRKIGWRVGESRGDVRERREDIEGRKIARVGRIFDPGVDAGAARQQLAQGRRAKEEGPTLVAHLKPSCVADELHDVADSLLGG